MPLDIKALVAIFTTSGLLHFLRPEPFERIVPEALPAKRELVYASGVAELGCAALLVRPKSRGIGGLLSAAVLIGVFPANISMTLSAFRHERAPAWYRIGTIVRLPLQFPMIRIAWKAAQGSK